MIDVSGYIAEVTRIHATGVAQEHAYRPALEKLFKSITDGVTAINEPKGSVNVGRPDFVFLRNVGKVTQITVGHCEAKDLKIGLNPKSMDDFNMMAVSFASTRAKASKACRRLPGAFTSAATNPRRNG